MKVKFLDSIAGPEFHYSSGEVYDLPIDEAKYWIREGLADKVAGDEGEQRPLKVQEIKKPETRPVTRKKK